MPVRRADPTPRPRPAFADGPDAVCQVLGRGPTREKGPAQWQSVCGRIEAAHWYFDDDGQRLEPPLRIPAEEMRMTGWGSRVTCPACLGRAAAALAAHAASCGEVASAAEPVPSSWPESGNVLRCGCGGKVTTVLVDGTRVLLEQLPAEPGRGEVRLVSFGSGDGLPVGVWASGGHGFRAHRCAPVARPARVERPQSDAAPKAVRRRPEPVPIRPPVPVVLVPEVEREQLSLFG